MKAGLIIAGVLAAASGGAVWWVTGEGMEEDVLQQPTPTPTASATATPSVTPSATAEPGAPVIEGIEPPSASFQQEVAILGSGFPADQGCSVHFNEYPAQVLDCNRAVDVFAADGQTREIAIVAVTPVMPESGKVTVTVTVSGLTSNAFPFDYTAPSSEDYIAGVISVHVKPGASIDDVAAQIGDSAESIERVFPDEYLNSIDISPEDRAEQERAYRVRVPVGQEVARVVAYSLHPLVQHAELYGVREAGATSNDPHFGNGRLSERTDPEILERPRTIDEFAPGYLELMASWMREKTLGIR